LLACCTPAARLLACRRFAPPHGRCPLKPKCRTEHRGLAGSSTRTSWSLAEPSCTRLAGSRRCFTTPGRRRLMEDRTTTAAVHVVIHFTTQLPKGVNQRKLAPSGASLTETKAHGAPVFFVVKLLDYHRGAATRQDSGRNHPGIDVVVFVSGRRRRSLAMVSTSPRPPLHLRHQRTTTSHFSLAFIVAGSLLQKLSHS
jgi:hypothetical protein